MIKGYASSKKDNGSENAYATVEPIREEQHGMSVLSHMTITSIATETAVSSTPGVIDSGGTVAKKGDVIQVLTGPMADREIKVESVDGDLINLSEKVDIGSGSDYEILRHKYPRVNNSGELLSSTVLAPAAVKFNKDAVLTDVSENTVTPASSVPLPVKVLKADGTVPDFATETTLGAVKTAVESIDSKDFATETTLALIAAKDFATQTTLAALLAELQLKADLTETQPVSVASLPLPSGAATAANQATIIGHVDGIEALLTSLNGKDFATETTLAAQAADIASLEAKDFATQTTLAALLAELQLKADLTDTQPVSVAALPLPSGAATEAKQDTIIGHVDGIEALLTSLDGKDFATQTTLAALNAKFSALGQNSMANSVPVTLASDQSNLPVKAKGGDIADSARKATGTVTSAAWVELIASTAQAAQGLCVFDSSGYSLELGVGGSGSEVRKLIIPPGGLNGFIPLAIPAGSRISIRALGTTADYAAAEHLLTLLQ